MHPRRLLCLTLAMMLAVPLAPARADEDSKAKAADLMERGRALYRQRRFRRAMELFERGHALDPDPHFLFNLGKCYERIGENDSAIVEYHNYLAAVPDAEDRAEVERIIRQLGGEPPPRPRPAPEPPRPAPPVVAPAEPPPAEAQAISSTPPAEPEFATEPTAAPPEPGASEIAAEPLPQPSSWRWAAWTTVGLGVAATGLGVLFVAQARSAADDANACLAREDALAPCQDDIDRHDSRRTLAAASLVVSAFALIGGGAWVYSLRDRGTGDARAAFDLGVTPREAVARYRFAF